MSTRLLLTGLAARRLQPLAGIGVGASARCKAVRASSAIRAWARKRLSRLSISCALASNPDCSLSAA